MDNQLILWFKDITMHDLLNVGGKGVNLGEMAKSLNVPPGFCLTSHAYIKNLKLNNIHEKILSIVNDLDIDNMDAVEKASQAIYQLILSQPLLPEIKEGITEAYSILAQGNPELKVAVRSSATAEDLPNASFAGQQDTYLNISGIDNVLEAIQKCWASLWTARAIHYRTKKQFDHSQVYMAVVIQEMLQAEIAGVMFTANPVNNSRKEILIEAVRGLGESLVSGTVTGDNYIINKENVQIKSKTIVDDNYGQLLPDEVIKDLAMHGIKIEHYYEDYQDIEWAYLKGKFYFLQCRSITTLEDEDPEEYDREKLTPMQRELIDHIYERYPEPIYPIDGIIVKQTYSAYLEAMADYGYYVPETDWARVTRGDFPEFFIPPRVRPRLTMYLTMPFILRNSLKLEPAGEWFRERKVLLDKLETLAERDVSRLPFDLVFTYLNEAINQYQFFIVMRYEFFVHNRLPSDVLNSLLRLMFGENGREIKENLLAGLPCITTEINDELRDMAVNTKELTEVRDYIVEGNFADFRDKISSLEKGPVFLEQLDALLDKYGDRETSMGLGGIASITWQDAPEVVMGIIRGLILEDPRLEEKRKQKTAERVKEAEEAIYNKLSHGLWRLIPKFFVNNLIKHTKSFDVFRENSHYDVTIAMKIFKIFFLEIGERFIRSGILTKAEDIYYLNYEEIKDIILTIFNQHKKLHVKEIRNKIADRQGQLARRRARWQNRDMKIISTAENSLHGIPASHGIVTGTVRIIREAVEFYKLQPGEIMVAHYTNPAWTPLFSTAGGLVVDTGGAASHAAIIAREYGIPAVMGTGNATGWLKDGDTVTLDGTTGLIVKTI